VQLVADPTQGDKDQYDRLLRYILLPDGTDFGLKMINDGDAYEYTYNTPYQNQASNQSAQAASRASGTGLWNAATCNGRRTLPAPQPAPVQQAPAPDPTTPTTDTSGVSPK
jgi:micrococcal nuclease